MVEEYSSGKLFEYMRQIDFSLRLLSLPFIKHIARRKLSEKVEKYRGNFILAHEEDIEHLINSARTIAIGHRMCYHLYKKDMSYAVYLDELAEALIQNGYAEKTSRENAIRVMREGRKDGRLQLVSRVSGKSLELCNQSLETCSLWKLERAGFKIMERV